MATMLPLLQLVPSVLIGVVMGVIITIWWSRPPKDDLQWLQPLRDRETAIIDGIDRQLTLLTRLRQLHEDTQKILAEHLAPPDGFATTEEADAYLNDTAPKVAEIQAHRMEIEKLEDEGFARLNRLDDELREIRQSIERMLRSRGPKSGATS